MNIPSFTKMKLIQEDGTPTMEYAQFMSQLTQALQGGLSQEGIKTPGQTAANITVLNTQKSLGNLVYDTDNDKLMVNIAGTFKTVTTS